MSAVEIPAAIDDPPLILLWPADEMMPVLIGLVFGVVSGNAFLFTAGGLLLTRVYRRFRNGHPDGYFLHLLYWYGVMPARAFSVPISVRFSSISLVIVVTQTSTATSRKNTGNTDATASSLSAFSEKEE